MSIKLKDRLLKLLNGEQASIKVIKVSESELNKLVEERANQLLEEELSTLDKAFLKEVSDKMNSINVNNQEDKQELSKEDKIKNILKSEE